VPDSALTSAATLAVAGLFTVGALAIYLWQLRLIVRDGGKVQIGNLDLPELLMSVVFAGLFAMLTVAAILRHGTKEPEVHVQSILPNSILFILFTLGIAGFLHYRGMRLLDVFGLNRVRFLPLLGWACGLLAAAFPLVWAANTLTVAVFHDIAEPQPLVELFNTAARHHDYGTVSAIVVSAVFIQPACEEFLFRGFFYAVWKKHLGAMRSGFISSVLFAAFHTNLAAFAGLCVLAVCLNVAYERTGSLFVPVLMHMLFNFTSLLLLFSAAQSSGLQ